MHNTVEAVIRQESAEESTALSRASSRMSEAQAGMRSRAEASTASGAQSGGTNPRQARPMAVMSTAQNSSPATPMRQPVTALRVSLALRRRPKSMGQTT